MKRKYNKKAAQKPEKKLEEKSKASNTKVSKKDQDAFTNELISQLNKDAGSQIAWNLESGDAPTNIKRWISTGSRQLDSILSNKVRGGLPEGRIVEISGPSSSGKSHICLEVAKATQKLGGIVVYMDTENATNLENLRHVGVDVHNRFVFVQSACTEELFAVAESAILKARGLTKDVPVTIIWDSIAASSPKAELEGNYDQNTIGLQARVMGKGLRKITNIIGNQNVLFLLVNQQRKAIGVMFGDDTTTPGGMAIPYSCSVRIRITSTGQSHIKDKDDNIIGIKVKAKTIKNKVAKPFRDCEFQIIFGKGVYETEEVFDLFRGFCADNTPDGAGLVMPNGETVLLSGTGAWKNFLVTSKDGEVVHDIKFHKPDFGNKVLNVSMFSDYMEAFYEGALVIKPGVAEHVTLSGPDEDSYEEIRTLAAGMKENGDLDL